MQEEEGKAYYRNWLQGKQIYLGSLLLCQWLVSVKVNIAKAFVLNHLNVSSLPSYNWDFLICIHSCSNLFVTHGPSPKPAEMTEKVYIDFNKIWIGFCVCNVMNVLKEDFMTDLIFFLYYSFYCID